MDGQPRVPRLLEVIHARTEELGDERHGRAPDDETACASGARSVRPARGARGATSASGARDARGARGVRGATSTDGARRARGAGGARLAGGAASAPSTGGAAAILSG